MKYAALLVVLAFIFQNCQQSQEERIDLGESGDAHQYRQLKLFPIRANRAFLKREKAASYVTLSEAVTKKKVSITERSGDQYIEQRSSLEDVPQMESGAEVNKLFIENTSSDTVLILGGEIVEGGNQDRTIAQDVVLPPHSGKIDLSVFCVEHGRWSGDTDTFAVAKSSLAPSNVRKAALKAANQEVVWENVAKELEYNKVSSGTQAVTELKKTEEYIASQREYEQALNSAFENDKSVIGVIAVAGNEIIACELFASHELFQTYYPNLLQSWVSQAATHSEEIVTNEDMVKAYFENTVRKKIAEEGFFGHSTNGKRAAHVAVF